MNKKNIFKAIAIGGLVISAPLAIFAYQGNHFNDMNNKAFGFNSEMSELSNEDKLELAKERTQIMTNQITSVIDILDKEGVDTSELDSIIEDYADLTDFLNSIAVDEMTKEELRDAFFEVRPNREKMMELRSILRENFDKTELKEIREDFKDEMNELRKDYDLTEIDFSKRGYRGNHRNSN